MVLTLLLVLSVRADRFLTYLIANPTFLLSDEECLPLLYRGVVLGKSLFLGLRENSVAARCCATTEQKLWKVGDLVDSILVPCWECPERSLDPILKATSVGALAKSLSGINKTKGKLVFSHTMEYLYLLHEQARKANRPSIFTFELDVEALDDHILLGTNGEIFEEWINACPTGNRASTSTRKPCTVHDLASAVDEVLPQSIHYADGSVTHTQHFGATSAQQTSCKMVQVGQTYLTGRTGGKDRDPDDCAANKKRKRGEIVSLEHDEPASNLRRLRSKAPRLSTVRT